jgi:hypothetical protein
VLCPLEIHLLTVVARERQLERRIASASARTADRPIMPLVARTRAHAALPQGPAPNAVGLREPAGERGFGDLPDSIRVLRC